MNFSKIPWFAHDEDCSVLLHCSKTKADVHRLSPTCQFEARSQPSRNRSLLFLIQVIFCVNTIFIWHSECACRQRRARLSLAECFVRLLATLASLRKHMNSRI